MFDRVLSMSLQLTHIRSLETSLQLQLTDNANISMGFVFLKSFALKL